MFASFIGVIAETGSASVRYFSWISQSLKHRPPIIGRAPWSLITIVTASEGISSTNDASSLSSAR